MTATAAPANTGTDVRSRILTVLDEKMKQDVSADISNDTQFADTKLTGVTSLGLDSLEVVELVMALEEEFGIEIPDEEAATIVTLGDAVTYVEGKLAA